MNKRYISMVLVLALVIGATAAWISVPHAELPTAQDALMDRVLGEDDAPITIIEYSSLTCPHCAAFHKDTFPLIKKNYIDTGKVRFIMRDFPFDRAALFASMMARCVAPDRYYGVLDVLFRSQDKWSRAEDPLQSLGQVGRMVGLGEEDFRSCLANRELMDGVIESRRVGEQEHEVGSTPTFVINGEVLSGAVPYEEFEKILDPLAE